MTKITNLLTLFHPSAFNYFDFSLALAYITYFRAQSNLLTHLIFFQKI